MTTTITAPVITAPHYVIKGKTRFKCVRKDCDGVHHVYCSCGTRAVA